MGPEGRGHHRPRRGTGFPRGHEHRGGHPQGGPGVQGALRHGGLLCQRPGARCVRRQPAAPVRGFHLLRLGDHRPFRPERPHYGNRRGTPAQRGNHRPLRHLRGPGAAHPGENHPADLHHQRDGGRRPQGGGGFRAVLPVLRGGRRAGGPQRLL